MPKYLVEGAKLHCTQGSKSKPVELPSSHNVDLKGKSLLNENDCKPVKNIPSFGICKLTQKPCIPITPGPWLDVNAKVTVDKKSAISVDSCLICMAGGLIMPEESGQTDIMEKLYSVFGPEKFAEMLGILNTVKRGGCVGGDPVNLCTGNFIYQKDDLKINGSHPLVFGRYYNSIDTQSGVLGKCWRHNHEISLWEKDDIVAVTFGDGHVECYETKDHKVYIDSLDKKSTVVKENDHFELKKEKKVYFFDVSGNCYRIDDAIEDSVHYDYMDEQLVKISNACGYIRLFYNPGGLLERIEDHSGRQVSYDYNEKNQLFSVANPINSITKYAYDEKGNLAEEIDPNLNAVFKNTYDAKARTIHQEMPNEAKMDFEYNEDEQKTIYKEPNGNRVRIYYDGDFRTVKISNRDGSEYFEYDHAGNRSSYQDRNGNQTLFEFNKENQLVRLTDSLGNEMRLSYDKSGMVSEVVGPSGSCIKRTFDDKNRLVSSTDPIGRKTVYAYGFGKYPEIITYPDGSVTNISYDSRGNIVRLKKSTGEFYSQTFDNLNRVTSYTDANKNTTRHEYNETNKLSRIINANGDKREYTYDANGNLISIADYDGFEVTYEYNEVNKCIKQVTKEGHAVQMEYDVMGNITAYIYPNGGTYRQKYDKSNRLVQIVDPIGTTTKFKYDANGNCTNIQKSNGEAAEFKYNSLNRKVNEVMPGQDERQFEYNEDNRLVRIHDAAGVIEYTYDAAGQPICITDSYGRKTHLKYNALGLLTEIHEPDGKRIVNEYSVGGRMTKSTLRDGSSIVCEYDNVGNILRETANDGYCISYSYDCLNRLIKANDSTGKSKTFKRDAAGNIVSSIDALRNETRYRYSPNGLLLETIDPMGNSTYCEYDEMGNVLSVNQCSADEIETLRNSDDKGRTIALYQRNIFGQAESYTNALGDTEYYHYDADGRIISKKDRDGNSTDFEYDLFGNLAVINYADGKTVKKGYDEQNRLICIEDWLGISTISYDSFGRPKSVVDHKNRRISYSWNDSGALEEMIYPDGTIAKYTYNGSGKITGITDGKHRVEYSYDEFSRLIKKELPAGVYSQYRYDECGRLCYIANHDKNGLLDQYRYKYDANGNKTEIHKERRGIEGDSGVFSYEYDALNRLAGVKKGDEYLRRYDYDGFGNRSCLQEKDSTVQYVYNDENQLIHEICGSQKKDYAYDRRGNLTEIIQDGVLQKSFQYGAQNQLDYAEQGGMLYQFTYNGLLQRTYQTISSKGQSFADADLPDVHTEYTLDLLRSHHNLIMAETDSTEQKYIWDWQKYIPALGMDGSNPMFYMHDDMGSTDRITDKNGYVQCSYAYDEFGNNSGNKQYSRCEQPFQYTGHEYDKDFGMYHTRFRYYDPKVGRFIGEDVVPGYIASPLSLNHYIYCLHNPLMFFDPDGADQEAMDMGTELHYLLKEYATKTYENDENKFVRPEFWIPTGSQTKTEGGFSDIIIEDVKEEISSIYEIKPKSSSYYINDEQGQKRYERFLNQNPFSKRKIINPYLPNRVENQISGYEKGLHDLIENPLGDLSNWKVQRGTEFNPDGVAFLSPSRPGIYYVCETFYETPGKEGVVYYTIVRERKREKMEARYRVYAPNPWNEDDEEHSDRWDWSGSGIDWDQVREGMLEGMSYALTGILIILGALCGIPLFA